MKTREAGNLKWCTPLTDNTMDIEDDEPFFAMSEADLALLLAEKNLITFALTTYVSDEVRKECEAEMELGRKSGWRITKNS